MTNRVRLWCSAVVLAASAGVAISACTEANVLGPGSGGSNGGSGGSGGTGQLTAPTPDSPGDDEQLGTLKPTLVVRNGTSTRTGTKTYEFQVSDSSGFGTIAATKSGVAEDISGKTSTTLDSDLQAATRFYWRARLVQSGVNSDWSTTGKFKTKIAGYNRAGELYDPLVSGDTVGTPSGSTSFVTGKGLKINDGNSYVAYPLPQTMSSGVFEMEVEGLYVNGPDAKMKVFSMFDGTGNLTGSRYEMSAQYRGLAGNPNNCISFKVVWGSSSVIIEPDLALRQQSVLSLNAAQTYFWQGTWTSSSFRLVIRDGGPTGGVVYDRTLSAPGPGTYSPSPHYAYLGATSGRYGQDTGSWPGVTYRNVWLSDKPRPTSLGSALRPER
jgi:hypothetical protein